MLLLLSMQKLGNQLLVGESPGVGFAAMQNMV
jgi:hypothetical protein